ncbi:putative leucine-rich repeat domain superfamily [Helianthus annuus]|uniref:Leucine-rich repeat domain superfamily n=2 Tax=Helianthus annuus TaxID=4232 RepID=A0A251U3S0_HELAN|nr:putative leucine-rich repeat domain superfamily [Helianthus annuus]KAJ0429906.1 putative leucine-rich repeat domain superfamily, transport inhibitor response 1 [Helianthus annuus]KAJ0807073.1 putative leucine-rich repeat domain superfamily, transport inhibitor response 1 [Helianthus annuus]
MQGLVQRGANEQAPRVNLVPDDWGADVQPWLNVFATAYPFLEELRLKRMAVSDESLEFLALNFDDFKAFSMLSCEGFSTLGLEAIATHCKNLKELDIQENGIDDLGGDWLSYFPENLTSLEVLNFLPLTSEVSFDALEMQIVTSFES